MTTVKNNVLVVTLSNTDAFRIINIANGKEAKVNYADCFGGTFKYHSNFERKFTEQFDYASSETTVFVTEDVEKKINALIEFNRVDN